MKYRHKQSYQAEVVRRYYLALCDAKQIQPFQTFPIDMIISTLAWYRAKNITFKGLSKLQERMVLKKGFEL